MVIYTGAAAQYDKHDQAEWVILCEEPDCDYDPILAVRRGHARAHADIHAEAKHGGRTQNVRVVPIDDCDEVEL